MKIAIRETVTKVHEVELSDELSINEILKLAGSLKRRYDTGAQAIGAVLKPYYTKYGEAFAYNVNEDSTGEWELDFEDYLAE